MVSAEESETSTSSRTGLGLVALVALCVVGLALGVQWLRERRLELAAHPQLSGAIRTAGLAERVEVRRDERGIPHISAANEPDLWFGLGFVHAQDRLAQLLWLRQLARGRSAEWLGDDALPFDRFSRTLGFGAIADAHLGGLPESTRSVLEAYARGVTARIERVQRGEAGLPTALRALGVERSDVEAWSAADSYAVFKLLCWGTGPSIESGTVLDQLTQRLGGVGARPFEPKHEALQTVSLPFDPPDLPSTPGAATGADSVLAADHRVPILYGGTAWVLAPRHTASGRPILAADLHLAPTAPALLHQVHLNGADIDWAGAAIPGVPVLWAGRSASLAWAVLPARAVNSVYFLETIRDRHPVPLYNDGYRWLPVEQRVEVLRVREPSGALREEQWVVRKTRHGPLLDGLIEENGVRLALGWTGAIEGDGLGSLLAVPRARNVDEARASLETHHEPVVTVVFADGDGGGGFQVAGWLPRRPLPTSLQPVPGRIRTYDLLSRVPFAALPAASLDGSDWIAVSDARFETSRDRSSPGAGSRVATGEAEWLWRSGARAARLERLLGQYLARGRFDLRDASAVQADVTSAAGPALVRALVSIVGEPETLAPEEREILGVLRDWDGELASNSSASAVAAVLVEELTREIFVEPMGELLFDRYRALPQSDLASVMRGVLTAAARSKASGGWSERARVQSAAHRALRRSWARVVHQLGPNRERWSWDRLQSLRFAPFVPGQGSALESPRPLGGGPGTLAAAGHDSHFRVQRASLFRMAVDLAVEDEMLVALAPGQQEEPGHRHFSDGLASWLEGRPEVLRTSPELIESGGESRLLLEPAS
jgi:penicillin amidase